MSKPNPVAAAAITVFHVLQKMEVDFVIAGGYARDVYYSRTPRDVDVWIVNYDEDDFQKIVDAVTEALSAEAVNRTAHTDDQEWGIDCIPQGSVEPDGQRINEVVNVGLVDLLFTGPLIEEARDVTDTFDFNYNQFAVVAHWVRGTFCVMTPEYWGEGVAPRCLNDIKQLREVTDERASHVLEKATGHLPAEIPFKEQFV